MKRISKTKRAILFCIAALVVGCATTTTKGTRLAELDAPITQMGILINQGEFVNSEFGGRAGTYASNKVLSDLMPRLPKRMQAVFAANDIESNIVLRSPNNKNVSAEDAAALNIRRYLLVISPVSATYDNRGRRSVEMRAAIVDRNNQKNIWTGAILFALDGLGRIDDKAADEFSKELLIQLNSNGMIQLKSDKPNLPK
jgi:hypothetical protein